MNEIEQLKTWDDWDEINLSTPELRQERLEILLCQKLKDGEDISQCLQALEYLKNQTTEQKLSQIYVNRVRNKYRLEILEMEIIIFLSGLACIIFLVWLFQFFFLSLVRFSVNATPQTH